MSDVDAAQELPKPQVVDGPGGEVSVDDSADVQEAVQEPAKVMRIGSMIKQLLEEVRTLELDEPARERLREIYDHSVTELGSALSDDLRSELDRLVSPFAATDTPTGAELVVAKAQLVGWLEGLFHGIQATLFAQQMVARQQLDQMRHQIGPGATAPPTPDQRPGTYL